MAATYSAEAGNLPEEASSLPSLNIVFVTKADLPEGLGHTVRLRSLVRTLTLLGHRVSIWNQHSLGVVPETSQSVAGELEGAPYRYVLGTCARGNGLGSLGTKFRAVKTLTRDVRTAHRREKIDLLWFNQLTFYDTYPLTLLARRLGIPTVQAYEDDHLVLTTKDGPTFENHIFSIDARLADRYCPPLASAIVVISTNLMEKYGLLVDSERVHLLPTLVDCQLWKCREEQDLTPPIILYAGAFGAQDEIEKVIEALGLLHSQGVRFQLVMLGGNQRDPIRMANIRSLILGRGLSEVVEMRGFVSSEEVRRQVENSNLLLCIRRDSKFSCSGLSTKLSEHLASGRMVITSALGDVPKYLVDGESALLLPPNPSLTQIASAIAKGLSSYELRRMIGSAGRTVAERFFDFSVGKTLLRRVLLKVASQRPDRLAAGVCRAKVQKDQRNTEVGSEG